MNFSDMLATLDGAVADQLCDDATWSGVAHVVRVLLREEDETLEWGGSSSVASSVILEVRVSEVAAPRPGDQVQIGLRRFRLLRDEPRKSTDGSWWVCEAEEISA
jgi:hypothetical protein